MDAGADGRRFTCRTNLLAAAGSPGHSLLFERTGGVDVEATPTSLQITLSSLCFPEQRGNHGNVLFPRSFYMEGLLL